MLRVLHVFKTYTPDSYGGIEQVMAELARGGEVHGIRSEILVTSPSPDPATIEVDGVPVHRVGRLADVASTPISLSLVSRFGELARTADVVHYHYPWPMMDLLHLHRRPKSVVTYHSDIVRQRRLEAAYRPLMMAFLSRVDRIVATSPDYLATSPVLRALKDRTTVIPIGIGDRASVHAETMEALARRLPERFFLFVGAMRYYKGLTYLIEAARETGLPVVIAGDGEMLAEAEATRPANVTTLGYVDNDSREALLELCHASILPSHLRSEAFGVALVEAARAGRAMICCRLGTGTTYVNAHGETGLVVEPADSRALASAMETLWRDPAMTAEMGRSARARFEAHFRAKDMAARYADLYREVASTGHA